MQLILVAVLVIIASTSSMGGRLAEPNSCSRIHRNIETTCNITKYPTLNGLSRTRGPDEFKTLIRRTDLQTVCTELRGIFRCLQGPLQSISNDCNARLVLTKEAGLPAVSQVLDLLEDVCANDLDAIRANQECFLNFAQREKDADICINEIFHPAMATGPEDFDVCALYSEIFSCAVNKLNNDPGCGPAAKVVASKVGGRLVDIYVGICRKFDHYERTRYRDRNQQGVPSFLNWKKFF